MDASTFKRFCTIAYDKAGITLGPSKEALVTARVGKRLRALGIATEKEYLARLEEEEDGEEIVQFLDVISTNHTAFFREPDHFELLKQVAGDWKAVGQKRVRIWSAASSTGEEPYTIAFTLADALDGFEVDWRILATDISTQVLRRAEAAVYVGQKFAGIERGDQRRYFDRAGAPDTYVVKDSIRKHVAFRRLNLANPPYPMRGPFDIIFCRNVMIYFDQLVRQRVISAMEKLLRPGGYLLIGHAEALSGIRMSLRMLRPSIFMQPEDAP